VPPAYGPFLSAVAAVAGALIGLLFVAVTVDPDRVRHQVQDDRQMNAALAFYAFVDPLFVALGGLLPGGSIAGLSEVLGAIGMVLTGAIGWRSLALRRAEGPRSRLSLRLLGVTVAVYAFQLAAAVVLSRHPGRATDLNDVCAALMGLFVGGILRAWELLGMTSPFASVRGAMHMPAPVPAAPAEADDGAAGQAPPLR